MNLNESVRQFRKDYEKLLKFMKIRFFIHCKAIKDL